LWKVVNEFVRVGLYPSTIASDNACARLSGSGGNAAHDEFYHRRYGTSSTYTDRQPAAAAVVIATSDVSDYHDDQDAHTVLTSYTPGSAAMATNCLCRYDDNDDPSDAACVLSARLGPSCRQSNRLKSRPPGHNSQDYQSDLFLRQS